MATYTPSELTSYLTHIRFPNPSSPPPPTLSTLRSLIIHHISNVPFENLSMHYRPPHAPFGSHFPPISVVPQQILTKLIPHSACSAASDIPAENGLADAPSRGGYCMEVNTVISTVLRTIGYSVWTIGGRGSLYLWTGGQDQTGAFGGWDHMATIVDLSEDPEARKDGGETNLWLVDIGFGGNGPIAPIPLIDGAVIGEKECQLVRVVRRTRPVLLNVSNPHIDLGWIFQNGEALNLNIPEEAQKAKDAESNLSGAVVRVSNTKVIKWVDGYHFYPFIPFLLPDYEAMSFATSTHPDAGFYDMMVCVRLLREDEITEEERKKWGQEITGKIIVRDRWLTRKIGGKGTVLKEFKNEDERVEALWTWFRIKVEKDWIRGGKLEIKEDKEEEKKKKEEESQKNEAR
ncbi:cysteine proteinase [Ascodesmis nigricans]|uniref:Cysteine proteinase n=1 Tax=Ascodesmis nigricans TaxID=341454 RepID=A0A4S2N7A0_9PEZI|nr:cysteine proteinase [Ascodesmis nigricans]